MVPPAPTVRNLWRPVSGLAPGSPPAESWAANRTWTGTWTRC